jgi:ABC-2 type transport system permease protein
VVKAEFKSFWGSASGGLALFVFLGLGGLLFYNTIASYALANLGAMTKGGAIDATLTIFSGGLGDLGLLVMLVTPLTTMKAFSVSKDGGHLDLLLTWPLSRLEMTLGLYLSACACLALMTALGLMPFIMLILMGVGNVKVLATSVLGLILMIISFSAIGLAVGSLTRAPLSAALTTLGVLGFLWAMGLADPYLSAKAGALLQGLAFGPRLSHFTLGLIDFNDVVYFLGLGLSGLWLVRPSEN